MQNASVRMMGAALIALIVTVMPALALTSAAAPNHHVGDAVFWAWVASGALLAVGTVTVTYRFQPQGTTTPVNSTTAPTAIQALGFNALAAVVEFSVTGDTTAAVIHNWGLGANAPTLFQPWVDLWQTTAGTGIPQMQVDVSNTNQVLLTKAAANGTAGSWVVVLNRPHSIVM